MALWGGADAQKVFVLKQGADGVPVAEICQKAGISFSPTYTWSSVSTRSRFRRRNILELKILYDTCNA